MAIKQLGAAESNNADAATKGYVDSAISTKIQAADGNGLTNSGDVLSVGAGTGITVNADDVAVTANYRSIAIPFYIDGAASTGIKTPEFIAPVAMSVVSAYARVGSGSGTAIRPSKNGGSSDGTILSSIGTTVVNNSQSVTLAAGDRLALNVTTAGTGTNLSVTFWANVT